MNAWLKREWPWLLGSLALIAWLLVFPYLQGSNDSWIVTDADELQPVPAAQWGHYRGARFRLIAIKRVPAAVLPAGMRLPPDTQVVVAGVEIVPDRGKDGETDVSRCSMTLRDGGRRGWKAAPNELAAVNKLLRLYGDCSRPADGLRQGPYQARQLFLLPAGVPLPDLRLELSRLVAAPEGESPTRRLSMQAKGGR